MLRALYKATSQSAARIRDRSQSEDHAEAKAVAGGARREAEDRQRSEGTGDCASGVSGFVEAECAAARGSGNRSR